MPVTFPRHFASIQNLQLVGTGTVALPCGLEYIGTGTCWLLKCKENFVILFYTGNGILALFGVKESEEDAYWYRYILAIFPPFLCLLILENVQRRLLFCQNR